MAIETINEMWAAQLENLRDEFAGIDESSWSPRKLQLQTMIDALQGGPTKEMLRASLEGTVGACDVLSISQDEHERYTIQIERDGRREWLREELDGSITGPLSEGDWINLQASE